MIASVYIYFSNGCFLCWIGVFLLVALAWNAFLRKLLPGIVVGFFLCHTPETKADTYITVHNNGSCGITSLGLWWSYYQGTACQSQNPIGNPGASIPPGGTGQIDIPGSNPNVWVAVHYTLEGNDNVMCGDSAGAEDAWTGNNTDIYIQPCGAYTPPPQTYSLAAQVCNDSQQTKTYVAQYAGTNLASQVLAPGQCWNLSLQDTQKNTLSISAQTYDYNNDGGIIGTNSTAVSTIGGSSDPGWSTGTPTPEQIADGSTGVQSYNPGGLGATNYTPPVTYTGATNTTDNGLALDSTLQQVGNSLYTSVNGQGNGIQQKLGGMSGQLTSIGAGIVNQANETQVGNNALGNMSSTLSTISGTLTSANGELASIQNNTANLSGIASQLQQANTSLSALASGQAGANANQGMAAELTNLYGLTLVLTNGVNSDVPWLNSLSNIDNSASQNAGYAAYWAQQMFGQLGGVQQNSQTADVYLSDITSTLENYLPYLPQIHGDGITEHDDLTGIQGALNDLDGKSFGSTNFISITNNDSVVVNNTNNIVVTNAVALTITNNNYNTNIVSLGGSNTNMPDLSGLGTNYDTASAIVSPTWTDSGFPSAVNDVGHLSMPDVGDGGGTPMTYSWSAQNGTQWTIQADLFTGDWGSMWQLMYNLAKWVLIAGFAKKVLTDCQEVVQTMATAQQFSVPNINAEFLGIGGNWGVAIAPALLIAILAAFAVLLAAIAGFLSSQMTTFSFLTNDPTNTASLAVLNGINYLKAAFPVNLAIGLTGGYLAWRALLTTSTGIAVLVIRALIGG